MSSLLDFERKEAHPASLPPRHSEKVQGDGLGPGRTLKKCTEGDSDDTESNAAPSLASTMGTGTKSSSLPVLFPVNTKVAACGLCNIKSDAASPLANASKSDPWSGYVPWPSYRKYKAGELADLPACKKPSGEVCCICNNTYIAAGFKAKHGTIAQYKKNVLAKGKHDEHAEFLEMRKKWIKLHNSGSSVDTANQSHRACRLSTSAVSELRTRKLEVIDSKKASFKAPRKQFVEAEHWDEKLDGIYDASKEVEVTVFGKKRKGVYKQLGRTGVWDAEEEEGKEIKDTRVEEEGVGDIVEHAADVKSELLQESFRGMVAQRQADAVEAKQLNFNELMALAGFDPDAVQKKEGEEIHTASGQADKDGSASEQDCSGDSSGVEEEHGHQRLNVFAVEKKVAKIAKTAVGQEVQAAVRRKAKGAAQNSWQSVKGSQVRGASLKTCSQQPKNVSGSSSEVLRIDGRTERIQKAAREQCEKSDLFLSNLKFDEAFEGVALTGEAEKLFIQSVSQKAHTLLLEKRSCQAHLQKIERSHLKSCFADEEAQLQRLIEKIIAVQAFLDFMRKPSQDLQASLQCVDAVIEMSFTISKPYLLRVLDASVQYKQLFSDDAGICEILRLSSGLSRRLLNVCSVEELSEVYAGKVEDIILTLLRSHTKEAVKVTKRKSDLAKALAARLVVFFEFAKEHTSTISNLQVAIDATIALVFPDLATAQDLTKALALLENLRGEEHNTHSAILTYFLGEGRTLFEEASAKMSERETELANDKEKNDFVDRCKAGQSVDCLLQLIDEFQQLQTDLANIQGRSKQDGRSYTKRQLSEIEDARRALLEHVVTLTHKELKDNVRKCTELFLFALDHHGYTEVPSTEQSVCKSGEALAPTTLKSLLMPPQFCEHQAWRWIGKHVTWKKEALLILDVMNALLAPTKGWTVFDQEKKIVDRESLGLVGPALVKLGFESEFIARAWQEGILDKYITWAESQLSMVASTIRHHMKECADGNFGALDATESERVLLLLPGKAALKQHISQLFTIIKDTGDILTSGSLANATKLASTLRALEQLKQNEGAFQHELTKIAAFQEEEDSKCFSKFVDDTMAKLKSLQSSKVNKTQGDIKKAIAATLELVNGISVASEKAFRADMKKAGSKLASKQKEVQALLTLLKGECPDIEAQGEACQQDDQTLAALYTKGKNAEAACIEYTCVFVSFQLWGNDATRRNDANGVSLRTNLAKALSTRAACGRQDIFKDKIAEMQKFVEKNAAVTP